MRTYSEIKIGDAEYLKHKITQADIEKFVELTGDDNKLHVDEKFASTTQFKKPVVHGMLGASFISTIIGTKLPGDGALWFSQTLEFILPVRIEDELTISAKVTKKFDKDNIIELAIEITNQDRQTVTKGIAKVKVVEIREENVPVIKQNNKQKCALVIGGTGGIGRAVCKQLASDGFHVFISFLRNKSLANSLKHDIVTENGKATILQCDITNSEEINALRHGFERYEDSLDVLINCSSIKIPRIGFKELTWRDFNDQINFHVKSVFEVSKSFIDLLEKTDQVRL